MHLREIGFEEIPRDRAPLWTGAAYANDGIEKVLQFDLVHCPVKCPRARHPDYVLKGASTQEPLGLVTTPTAYLHIHLACVISSPEFELRVLGRAQSLRIRVGCIVAF